MSHTLTATSRALLEMQSPTQAVIAERAPLSGRVTIWVIAATIASSIAAMTLCQVDRVVAVPGKVVSQIPNLVVQPLDTAIVRHIFVREGDIVRKGELLARLDPTMAQADAHSLDTQAAGLQAEVDRLTAEAADTQFHPDGSAGGLLQAMLYAQRHAENAARLENYRQKIDSLRAKVVQTSSDIAAYTDELQAARAKEVMRQQLEKLQIGSKLNTLDAGAQRAEVNRSLQSAIAGNAAAKSDLDALIAERDGYVQKTHEDISQQLTEQSRKLSDVRDQQAKAALHRQLIDMHADCDATVLDVAKVSPGSVVQSGDQLITLVPAGAPLAIEAEIPSRDAGFARPGAEAVIKFDTFPYTTYGFATGELKSLSADSFTSPRADAPGRPEERHTEAGGTYFRASVSMDAVKLHHLPAGFQLTPGMPVTTDIKAGKRTVMGYLLSRIVPSLTEGMREP